MRERVAAFLQAAGIAAGVAAGFTVSVTAGLGVACVGCVLLGIALERG